MRRILVVDDDPHICLAVRAWLKRCGFKVAIADCAVPLIAISGYAFSSLEGASPDFPRMAIKLGATRCLRKPFRPTTLLSVIDECLLEAEPHRKNIAALVAVTRTSPEQSFRKPREHVLAD